MPKEFDQSHTQLDEYIKFKQRYPKDIAFLDRLVELATTDEIAWALVTTFLVGTLSLDHLTSEESIAQTLDLSTQEVNKHLETLFENSDLYTTWENLKDSAQKRKAKRVRPSRAQSTRPSGILPVDPRVIPLRNVPRSSTPVIKRKIMPERFDPTQSFFQQKGNGEHKTED